jgi:hypothetical protein
MRRATRTPTHLTVRAVADADRLMKRLRASAARVHDWIAAYTGDPLDMLGRMKFKVIGFHSIENRPLNAISAWVAVSLARRAAMIAARCSAGSRLSQKARYP